MNQFKQKPITRSSASQSLPLDGKKNFDVVSPVLNLNLTWMDRMDRIKKN